MTNKERIISLIDEINARKMNQDSLAATYKDVPLLKELNILIKNESDLSLKYDALEFVASQYESMGRFSVASSFRLEALDIASGLTKDVKNMLILLLRDRNYYVDDDCYDVEEIAKKLLPLDVINGCFDYIKRHRRSLKHDPIEMSQVYLDAIDEVEERIEKKRTFKGMGSCYEIWDLKEKYLLEKGIVWKSPHILNPKVLFD